MMTGKERRERLQSVFAHLSKPVLALVITDLIASLNREVFRDAEDDDHEMINALLHRWITSAEQEQSMDRYWEDYEKEDFLYGKADVKAIYDKMDEDELLEDRREYTQDDLKRSYNLTDQEADDLYYLIQRDFDPQRVASYGMEDRFDPKLVVTTITEALHQGLDGWSPHEQCVIERFLDDIALAVKCSQ